MNTTILALIACSNPGWNFDNVNTSNGPVPAFTVSGDFSQNGINAIGWTEDSLLVIGKASREFPNVVGNNCLYNIATGDNAFILRFSAPITSFTFTVPTFVGPFTIPAWSVSAINNGDVIQYLAFDADYVDSFYPSRNFTVSGDIITSVRFNTTYTGNETISSIMIDRYSYTVPNVGTIAIMMMGFAAIFNRQR